MKNLILFCEPNIILPLINSLEFTSDISRKFDEIFTKPIKWDENHS